MSNEAGYFHAFGPFCLDLRKRALLRDGQPEALAPKTVDIHAALVEDTGNLAEKSKPMQRVWPDATAGEGLWLAGAWGALPAEAWQAAGEGSEVTRECADVPSVPSEKSEEKDSEPPLCAIRLRQKQGELFYNGTAVNHFAVASDLWV